MRDLAAAGPTCLPHRLSQYPHPSHTDHRPQPVPGQSWASGIPTVQMSHQPHEVPLATTTRPGIGTVDHLGQQVSSVTTRRKSPSLSGRAPSRRSVSSVRRQDLLMADPAHSGSFCRAGPRPGPASWPLAGSVRSAAGQAASGARMQMAGGRLELLTVIWRRVSPDGGTRRLMRVAGGERQVGTGPAEASRRVSSVREATPSLR